MEENRKNDQAVQELKSEEMEQVSGGRQNEIKTRFCRKCTDVTTWIFLKGVWTCGKCGYGENSPYNDM